MQFVAGTRSRKSSEKARRSRNPFLPYNSLRERVPENHARFPQPISTMRFVARARSCKSSAHGRHPNPVCRRQNVLEARLGFSARLPDHLANVGEGRKMPFAASRAPPKHKGGAEPQRPLKPDFWRKSGFLATPASVWVLPFSLPFSRGKGKCPRRRRGQPCEGTPVSLKRARPFLFSLPQ